MTTHSRTESIKLQLRRLENELARIESVPDPAEWPEDTTVLYRKTFGRSVSYDGVDKQTYTYVAVKANGLWWRTGKGGATPLSDPSFRIELSEPEVGEISVVESWTQIQ